MIDKVKEDVNRMKCIRHILNLCMRLDSKIDEIIDTHHMMFYKRKANDEEITYILGQVNEIMKKENKNSDKS